MENPLPFKLNLDGPLSRWRAETFWTKEPETILWLNHFSGSKKVSTSTLLDVGANIGVYSLYWLTISMESKVISCEPFRENFDLLKSNLELNSLMNRAFLISKPLFSDSVSGTFVSDDLRPGSSGSQFALNTKQEEVSGSETISITIDEVLLDSQESCILKIDVDGLDFEILKGAKTSLASQQIYSVLIEAPEQVQKDVELFLYKFSFLPDPNFNDIDLHSDSRRKLNNSPERNRVYTLKRFL